MRGWVHLSLTRASRFTSGAQAVPLAAERSESSGRPRLAYRAVVVAVPVVAALHLRAAASHSSSKAAAAHAPAWAGHGWAAHVGALARRGRHVAEVDMDQ